MLPGLDGWREVVKRDHGQFARVPAHRLGFATVIVGGLRVADPSQSDHYLAWTRRQIAEFRAGYRARALKWLPGIRWRGAFEVDLLHPDHMGPQRLTTLASMGLQLDGFADTDRVILPHLHAVIDLGEYDRDRVVAQLKAEYPGPWRVHMTGLHTDKPVALNLELIAGYVTKQWFSYAKSYEGVRTKAIRPYEPEWRDCMLQVVGGLGYDLITFNKGR